MQKMTDMGGLGLAKGMGTKLKIAFVQAGRGAGRRKPGGSLHRAGAGSGGLDLLGKGKPNRPCLGFVRKRPKKRGGSLPGTRPRVLLSAKGRGGRAALAFYT